MPYVVQRITFLRTLKLACVLCLAASCVVLLTPRDTAALNLSHTLGQLAKVTKSVQSNTKKTSIVSTKRQSDNTNTAVTETQANPQPAPATPQTPPSQEALPPQIQPISTIPSHERLVALASKPLIGLELLKPRSTVSYPDADSFAVLRPSTEGWKFLGLSWLWWTAGLAVAWLGMRWFPTLKHMIIR